VQGLTPACDGKPPRLQVDRTRRLTAASLEDPAYDILYGAPALIVIFMQRWFIKGLVDTEK
jgi:hypothetical protein